MAIINSGESLSNFHKRASGLAEEHWDYVRQVIENQAPTRPTIDAIDRIGFHYKTAFVHGYKHAVEDIDANK